MKIANITFKVLGYIIILGGLALLVLFALYPSEYEMDYYTQEEYVEGNSVVTQPTSEEKTKETTTIEKSTTEQEAISLTGKWKVTYKSLEGSIVYDIKKEGKLFNAYTSEIQDENGYGEKVTAVKTLIIKSFNGKRGKGTYKVEFEGKKYNVPCKIKLIDKHTFQLSYDYYGYKDTEVWKRD
ncbi:hypothetical protein [Pseudotenacibaculum haliotis]|uniref:DUF5640 domain-containing protein n=1 Tax=Pseudotenacibaculum haliotis TaxID=1862138 RepID=A0ABW5LT69_9FLAO